MHQNRENIYFWHFFQNLLNIIQDKQKIAEAVRSFQDDKPEQIERYTANKTLGLQLWPQDAAQQFTAAVAEALIQTTQFFLKKCDFDNEDDNKIPDDLFVLELNNHGQSIQHTILPQLIESIDPRKPFDLLDKRIELMMKRYEEKKRVFEENRNLFFFVGAATTLAVTANLIFGS